MGQKLKVKITKYLIVYTSGFENIYTKYEVSMSNSTAGGLYTDNDNNDDTGQCTTDKA